MSSAPGPVHAGLLGLLHDDERPAPSTTGAEKKRSSSNSEKVVKGWLPPRRLLGDVADLALVGLPVTRMVPLDLQ